MDRRPQRRELEARFGAAQFQQLLEQLAERAGGAVFVVDAQNTVLYWSRSAQREFGRSAFEMVGRHCLMGISCAGCLARCALADDAPPSETRIKRRDGSVGAYRRSVFRMLADDGSYVGGVELLVPVETTVVELDPSGVASFGALRTVDPLGVRALDELVRARAGSEAVMIVAQEPWARLAVARELASGRDGPFVRIDPWTPDAAHRLDQIESGTVFVDEVASSDPSLQLAAARLCGAPERGRPRLVAGASRPTKSEVRSGRIRPELGALLSVGEVVWPDLTLRPADIERIVDEGVAHWARVRRPGPSGIERQALERLKRRTWVGGEPELRGAIESVCLRVQGPIRETDLPAALDERAAPAPPDDTAQRRATTEARRIQRALTAANGNLSKAAEELGISRTTLYRRRRKLGI